MSKCIALEELNCYRNYLTKLDVSNNPDLTYLDCNNRREGVIQVYGNQLTLLDVSKNIALKHLNCEGLKLTTLDVSNNPSLEYLICRDNQLTALNLNNDTALTSLSCSTNQLTALDVSHNIALRHLHCVNNQIVTLDVSKNTALTSLSCSGNQLTILDVSHNTFFEYLYCNLNQMLTLDLSNNTALSVVETDSQNFGGLKLNTNNDGTYYIDLMNDYGMTSAQLSRIVAESVKGYNEKDNNILTHYNPALGVANFKERPVRFCYIYDTGQIASAISDVSMDVTISAIPVIITEKPDDAYVNRSYSFTFSASGAGTIRWSIDDASKLPEDLTLSTSNGKIKGTPRTTGEYKFRLTASNKVGSDTKEFTLKVNVAPDDPNPSPKGQSNEGGGGGCNSVSGMIMVIGLCVMHGLKINRRN